jgi:hypothetical protein
MSAQAMQQLHISGVVRYGDNYQAVKDDYLAAATGKTQAILFRTGRTSCPESSASKANWYRRSGKRY